MNFTTRHLYLKAMKTELNGKTVTEGDGTFTKKFSVESREMLQSLRQQHHKHKQNE